MCKLAEHALSPIACVISEDIKYYWSQHEPLRNTAHGVHLGIEPLTINICAMQTDISLSS